uniref:GRF-type domain-containing protein n=1 Tax=Nelumbo nucifera TaxID=4432 RepID=A0A822ZKC6_NELNU|nr:TPA_asm: hypothetical protein HUJ06_016471 [Nelumbo nucifera]
MSSQSTSQSTSYKKLKYPSRICDCGKKCVIHMSETNLNPQRLFYNCLGIMEKKVKVAFCNYFEWPFPTTTSDEATSSMNVGHAVTHAKEINRLLFELNRCV